MYIVTENKSVCVSQYIRNIILEKYYLIQKIQRENYISLLKIYFLLEEQVFSTLSSPYSNFNYQNRYQCVSYDILDCLNLQEQVLIKCQNCFKLDYKSSFLDIF